MLTRLYWVVQFEVLTAEKASMASGLEAKDVQMESMQQEHSNVQTQLVLCQERVSQLQTELTQVRHSSGQAAFVVHLVIKQHLSLSYDLLARLMHE